MRPDLVQLLPDLVLFVAVGRAKSFSRAARSLGMPVSTLSRRVSDFEGRLGVQLLHRSTRRVELTETGNRYFERCQVLVDAAEAAQAELHGETERPVGTLRVSVSPDFGLTYLAPIVAEFANRFPEVSCELDLTPRFADLIAEGIDVAIRMGSLPDSQLFARKLGSAASSLYAAPNYLRRAAAVEKPADLARHECLRISGSVGRETLWSLIRGDQVETVAVQGRLVANGMRVLLELATSGLGIASLDDSVARTALEKGQVVRVLPDWRPPAVRVHALMPSKLLPARTRAFLECLANHLRL